MRKEVVVCDFCLRKGIDKVAKACCCICSKDYCAEHNESISVLVESGSQCVVRDSCEVCPDCRDLLAFDNWTSGERSTRDPKFDRPIVKMVLLSALEAVKKSLKDICHSIGPDDVRDWVSKRGVKQ